MIARRIIEGAAFDPEVLEVMAQVFDETWAAIADRFSPLEHRCAREHLAQSIVLAARDDTRDVVPLRQAGLTAMHIKYPSRFATSLDETIRSADGQASRSRDPQVNFGKSPSDASSLRER